MGVGRGRNMGLEIIAGAHDSSRALSFPSSLCVLMITARSVLILLGPTIPPEPCARLGAEHTTWSLAFGLPSHAIGG